MAVLVMNNRLTEKLKEALDGGTTFIPSSSELNDGAIEIQGGRLRVYLARGQIHEDYDPKGEILEEEAVEVSSIEELAKALRNN